MDYFIVTIRKVDKDVKFENIKHLSSKLEVSTKLKKRILSPLAVVVIKIRKNIQYMYQKNVVKLDMLIYY